MTPSAARRLLLAALAVHVVFSVQRLPTKAIPRRLEQIRQIEEHGLPWFHLQHESPETIAAVQFLEQGTPRDAVVLFRGEPRGALELAAGLLAPRLLYREDALAPQARTVLGREVAGGTHPQLGSGTFVLSSAGGGLRLELR